MLGVQPVALHETAAPREATGAADPAAAAPAYPAAPSGAADAAGASAAAAAASSDWGWSCDDNEEETPGVGAGGATFGGAFLHPPSRLLGWAGACLRLRARGAFQRRVAWALRLRSAVDGSNSTADECAIGGQGWQSISRCSAPLALLGSALLCVRLSTPLSACVCQCDVHSVSDDRDGTVDFEPSARAIPVSRVGRVGVLHFDRRQSRHRLADH
jgi:hypothetical protein